MGARTYRRLPLPDDRGRRGPATRRRGPPSNVSSPPNSCHAREQLQRRPDDLLTFPDEDTAAASPPPPSTGPQHGDDVPSDGATEHQSGTLEMTSLRQIPLTCSGHTRPVVHLDFSSVTDSGYFLISACKDGKPMLRQGDTGDWIGTFEGHKGAVWGVALNSDATRAATGAADFTGKVWDAVSGEELHSFQHNHIVKSVDFSMDSGLLATGSNEKLIRIFDLNKTEAAPEVFSGHTAGIKNAILFRDDKCIISCADDKTLRVWDRSVGKEVQKMEFSTNPGSIEVSKDGSVITVAHSMNVTFLESTSLTKIRDVTVPSPINSASLHPDKTIFVAGGDDLKVYKFDYTTGTEIESFKGHFGPVHCVKFSPDGELYASGSEDGTLRLWQTTLGKTYGLWKCVDGPQLNDSMTIKEVPAS